METLRNIVNATVRYRSLPAEAGEEAMAAVLAALDEMGEAGPPAAPEDEIGSAREELIISSITRAIYRFEKRNGLR